MKKFFIVFSFLFSVFIVVAQDLSYYLPAGVEYDASVPVPKDIIYHEVGEWHVTHDRLVNYMQALAKAAPGRIRLETMGFTYEQRPQVLLIISSTKNLNNLEQIRQQHVALSNPAVSGKIDVTNMPIVVYIGHSIHGNEPSGANAALLTAYYLAAAQGKNVEEILDNCVILFDPSFNPDGLQRFSTWVNQHKSKNDVTNPQSREFNEVWPGGRFNHYWFDLNRDWLPAVHIESKNRLEWYQKWLPNILTDHHEQGSNATFFFQPGVPSRVNPLTPAKNQELTARLGNFHAKALDSIGSFYFTKESYDDFYYGKGSTYPDINGGIGILFEQASSRGHAQLTVNGVLRFPFTIRNQFVTALSTLNGAVALRRDFLNYQRDFYTSALREASDENAGAYIFGEEHDVTKSFYLADMLRRHRIEVYQLAEKFSAEGKNFKPGHAFIVPVRQDQYRLIKAIFERTLKYSDSLFYDITTWTMPLAFGLDDVKISAKTYTANLLGAAFTGKEVPVIKTVNKSNYAYLLDWRDYFAPAALFEIQNAGLLVKAATKPFSLSQNGNDISYAGGTILVQVQGQKLIPDSIRSLLQRLVIKYGVHILGVNTGLSTGGTDLGSSSFKVVSQPEVALITGAGVNPTDAGEVWFLLDQRFNMPPVLLEASAFNRGNASDFNTIIMVGGNYDAIDKEKLKAWVRDGGTLILTEEAVSWASKNGISNVKLRTVKSPYDSIKNGIYNEREQVDGAQQMNGVILGTMADMSHPLSFGYSTPVVSLFKANRVYMEKSANPFASPFKYLDKPLQSGWLSRENSAAVKNSAAVVINVLGNGRIINIADNPNFRAFWMGGTRLMMNAVFFGRLIDGASARETE